MRIWLAPALFLTFAIPALAAEWNIRPWDGVMTRDDVVARVVGAEIRFPDGSAARYGNDGRYVYTYHGGREFHGAYQVDGDGAICVAFDAGQRRCDLYVLHDTRLVLITEDGRRFPTAVGN